MIQFDEHIFQMGWFNHQLGGDDPFNLMIAVTFRVDEPPLTRRTVWLLGLRGWYVSFSMFIFCFGMCGPPAPLRKCGPNTPNVHIDPIKIN